MNKQKKDIKELYPSSTIEKAEDYVDRVSNCIKIGNFVYGRVQGTYTYKTEVDLETMEGDCSCPIGHNCKHVVALFLSYNKRKCWDAKDFIKNLDNMSKNGLKELILSKLKDNPDWIIKHNLKKSIDKKYFVVDFKKNFSSEKIDEAELIIAELSLEQLFSLYDYINDNYDDLAEKLGEEDYNGNENYNGDYWDDEEYDKDLYNLKENIEELLIKRCKEKKSIKELLKREEFHDKIIENAETFKEYEKNIEKIFSKEDYLNFLLNLKNPDLDEVIALINKEDLDILYRYIPEKIKLIKEIAYKIDNKLLLFLIALYENNFEVIVRDFSYFDEVLKNSYRLTSQLKNTINLFKLKNFRDEVIAKRLLKLRASANLGNVQKNYLLSQINDFDFISKEFDSEQIEEDITLLERMLVLNKNRTLNYLRNKEKLFKRHWSEIILLFKFLRKNYSIQDIQNLVEQNSNLFKNSSHLKKHLKEECGIFISQREGKTLVEVK